MGVRCLNGRIFLVLSIVLCVYANPEVSVPVDEFDGWFVNGEETINDDKIASSYPPPGSSETPKMQKLSKCMFDNVFAIDEERKVLLLKETLLVDGCLLECGDKTIESTVRNEPIVRVRNGGKVKNCSLFVVDDNEVQKVLEDIDVVPGNVDGQEATAAPNLENDVTDDPAKAWAAYGKFGEIKVRTATSGFACDQGDCFLENSWCKPSVTDHMLRTCVSIEQGAAGVTINGGLVDDVDANPVGFFGILVDAGGNPAVTEATGEASLRIGEAKNQVRLLVEGVSIKDSLFDGIKVFGGANTIRITDSMISNNRLDGINLNGADGLEVFAILGGWIEDNKKNGIDVNEFERDNEQVRDFGEGYLPKKTEMVIADVSIKGNAENGIVVKRVNAVVMNGAIIDGNRWNGIHIWEANTIRLQGVVSKFNAHNGLAVEAIGADVDIDNSIFLTNGYQLEDYTVPHYHRAGVYAWLSNSLTMTNSVSKGNSVEGIITYEVSSVNLSDVDANNNGRDGIQIREFSAGYGYDYTANSDYLVGAYYYPWHGENFHNNGGYLRRELNPPQGPTLGEYDDTDPDVIGKHMEWFRKSNIGLLVTSWWGPDKIEDTTTRNVIMQHEDIGNLKIALHYETTGRIKDGDNMSVPKSDIQFMCEHYFDHPNYYTIDGRPVLVIYISRKLEQLGTLEKALLTMKSEASKCGHNLYLIGDAIFAKAPDVNEDEPFLSFTYFDAVTNFDVYGSSGASQRSNPYAGKEAVDAYYAEQEKWRQQAIEENCRYIPPVSPGYNDRGVRLEKDNPPLSRRLTESSDEGSLFEYQLDKALLLADPMVDNLILVNSFNEWHEDTQIEPTMGLDPNADSSTKPDNLTGGLEYVAYGEQYLEILRKKTSRSLVGSSGGARVVYEPSKIYMTNVQTCNNGEDGISFYVTDNNYDRGDGQSVPELILTPGLGVASCNNVRLDYKLNGGGGIDYTGDQELIGDSCANGRFAGVANSSCEGITFQNCDTNTCRVRNIVTQSGIILDDHITSS